MERVWIVLRMGGGEGLHHGEDEQARHVQVDIRQHCRLSICEYWLSLINSIRYQIDIRSQDPNNSSDTETRYLV